MRLPAHEHRISLAEAARRRGKAPTTAWRWALRGVVRAGQRIHLEAQLVGCRWETTVEALDRFERRLRKAGLHPPVIGATPSSRRTASEAAAAELAEHGI